MERNRFSIIAQWIVGSFFALTALVNGIHWSSLIFVFAAVLIMPIPKIRELINKPIVRDFQIKTWMIITLASLLFVVGCMVSPLGDVSETHDSEVPGYSGGINENESDEKDESSKVDKEDDNTEGDTSSDNSPEDNPPVDNPPEDNPPVDNPPVDNPPVDNPPVDNPPEDNPPEDNPPVDNPPVDNPPVDNPPVDNPPVDNPPVDNPPVDNPPVDNPPEDNPPATDSPSDKGEEMVWIPSTGKKYHTNSGCSNMIDPREVTIEEAEALGFEPCKRCH